MQSGRRRRRQDGEGSADHGHGLTLVNFVSRDKIWIKVINPNLTPTVVKIAVRYGSNFGSKWVLPFKSRNWKVYGAQDFGYPTGRTIQVDNGVSQDYDLFVHAWSTDCG